MKSSFPKELIPDDALYTLLCKYLLQEADMEACAWVEAWEQKSPDNTALLVSLRQVLDTATASEKKIKVDTPLAWSALCEKMANTPPMVIVVKSNARYIWLKIAAILLIAVGAGGWWLLTSFPKQTYTGPLTAVLKDGSQVQLLAASNLETARGFNKINRKVKLTGTAMFDVTSNAATPFVVILGRTEVKVLGTRFLINYEPDKATLKVHVSNGKVMVIDHDKADSAVLTEGMLLQQHMGQQDFRVTSHVTDVVKKSLSFSDTPLEEVLNTITTVYDVKVEVVRTDLLKLPVRANFNGESADEIIQSLALMLNAGYVKIGDRQYQLK